MARHVSESSLSVGRRRNDESLSLRGSSRKQRRTSLSLSVAVAEEVRFFVAVAVVDGALYRWLSSTATELSLMALSDSLR
ncbi:hypothetical protein F2Q69_00040281 [Brassica cretica]|uniref:Uncharacterized protein n=1 Tax=Brassica cretica TaxID=69181 RepID=A0A8S9NN35_BRACR|nr:hypothetical protein F2Q69_00040281 [Brassica cretica]